MFGSHKVALGNALASCSCDLIVSAKGEEGTGHEGHKKAWRKNEEVEFYDERKKCKGEIDTTGACTGERGAKREGRGGGET